MPSHAEQEILTVAGREVTVSNPRKVLFPRAGHTKLDLVRYYLAVADGALRGAGGRPNVLVRYPNGIGDEHLFQKRAPKACPPSTSPRGAPRSHARPGSRWSRSSSPPDGPPKKWCRVTRRRSPGWPTS